MTDTTTQSLAEWLLDRIAEDEKWAREALALTSIYHPATMSRWHWIVSGDGKSNWFPTSHDPARVLAECAAKRRIVAAHPRLSIGADDSCEVCADDGAWYECGMLDWPCPTFRALASIYADAPGFREEWAL